MFYYFKRKKGKRDITDVAKEIERRTKDSIDAAVKEKMDLLQKMLADAAAARSNGKINSLVFVILV